jgi:hypothetical protein
MCGIVSHILTDTLIYHFSGGVILSWREIDFIIGAVVVCGVHQYFLDSPDGRFRTFPWNPFTW